MIFSKMKKHLSRLTRVSFCVTAITLLIYLVAIRSESVADLVNSTVSVAVRFVLSSLTYLLPFSFFELLIIISPVILVVAIWLLVGRDDMLKSVLSVLAIIGIIFSTYVYTLGVGYRTTRLAERTNIDASSDITQEELTAALSFVLDGIREELPKLEFWDGETRMPYSMDEMSKKLIRAYGFMNQDYSILTNYTSRVKAVRFSTVMSDLGIGGIYSFFTGEANVNVEYPDYCLPFTSAHEMAHQRGISREDEASFVAFLVCIYSDDAYIRYSGYLNMFEYLASALYSVSPDLYYEAVDMLPGEAYSDIRASDAVYIKHMDSPLGKLNNRLNDAYLKANGTEGVISYNYVVRLAVGYYQKQNNG